MAKTEIVKFRVTPDEKKAIETAAAATGETVSDFMRRHILTPSYQMQGKILKLQRVEAGYLTTAGTTIARLKDRIEANEKEAVFLTPEP